MCSMIGQVLYRSRQTWGCSWGSRGLVLLCNNAAISMAMQTLCAGGVLC